MSSNSTYIYVLIESRSFNERFMQIRYVGKSNNPKDRLADHLNPSQLKEKSRKNNWIKSLKADGFKPEMEICAKVPEMMMPESRGLPMAPQAKRRAR